MGPKVVSGAVSTIADIGRDEAWLRDWLNEQPARMGLGELFAVDGQGDARLEGDQVTGFWAADDERLYCVDVRLGELEAAAAFGVLQGWAASLGHEPGKEHVAVLVTERLAERYRSTLTALAERLPLLVVGLSVWRGEDEAIVVPHVALASATLDLSDAPAVAAAASLAAANSAAASMTAHQAAADTTEAADPVDEGSETAADSETAEAEALAEGGIHLGIAPDDEIDLDDEVDADGEDEAGDDDDPLARLGGRDDTGIADPWRLSAHEDESSPASGVFSASGSR